MVEVQGRMVATCGYLDRADGIKIRNMKYETRRKTALNEVRSHRIDLPVAYCINAEELRLRKHQPRLDPNGEGRLQGFLEKH